MLHADLLACVILLLELLLVPVVDIGKHNFIVLFLLGTSGTPQIIYLGMLDRIISSSSDILFVLFECADVFVAWLRLRSTPLFCFDYFLFSPPCHGGPSDVSVVQVACTLDMSRFLAAVAMGSTPVMLSFFQVKLHLFLFLDQTWVLLQVLDLGIHEIECISVGLLKDVVPVILQA